MMTEVDFEEERRIENFWERFRRVYASKAPADETNYLHTPYDMEYEYGFGFGNVVVNSSEPVKAVYYDAEPLVKEIDEGRAMTGTKFCVPKHEEHGGFGRRPWSAAPVGIDESEFVTVVWDDLFGRVDVKGDSCLDSASSWCWCGASE